MVQVPDHEIPLAHLRTDLYAVLFYLSVNLTR